MKQEIELEYLERKHSYQQFPLNEALRAEYTSNLNDPSLQS